MHVIILDVYVYMRNEYALYPPYALITVTPYRPYMYMSTSDTEINDEHDIL